MPDRSTIDLLDMEITRILDAGLAMDAATAHFIDSTFGFPDDETLVRLLNSTDEDGASTLHELIFFPDERMQAQLEPILESHCFNAGDVEAVTTRIAKKHLSIPVRFPDARGEAVISLPEAALRKLMLRLRLTTPLDDRLSETIRQAVAPLDDAMRVRVMVRNSRAGFSNPSVEAMIGCIKGLYGRSPFFWEAFGLLLEVLETDDAQRDVYAGLIRKKQGLARLIHEAGKKESAMSSICVEALMMAGVRMPAIDAAKTRKQVALIDLLCLTLFGKYE